MRDLSVHEQGYLICFSTFYLFLFRDVIKKAAVLGAFEGRDWSVFRRKVFPYSWPILVFFPVLSYFLFLGTICTVVPTVGTSIFFLLRFVLTFACFVSIPRMVFHCWNLIANRKVGQGIEKGKSGFGWLNSGRLGDETLPNPKYSGQLIIFWFILFVFIVIAIGPTKVLSCFPYRDQFWYHMFIFIYLSQLIVLYQVSETRGFYYHDPKWIFGKLMFISIPVTIVLPVGLGVYIYPLFVEFDLGHLHFGKFFWCLMALLFPFCCHQSFFLIAKYSKLMSKNNKVLSEISEAENSIFGWICLIFGLIISCIVVCIRMEINL